MWARVAKVTAATSAFRMALVALTQILECFLDGGLFMNAVR